MKGIRYGQRGEPYHKRWRSPGSWRMEKSRVAGKSDELNHSMLDLTKTAEQFKTDDQFERSTFLRCSFSTNLFIMRTLIFLQCFYKLVQAIPGLSNAFQQSHVENRLERFL